MGGKYVTGNFEENGKKYRDSPEKTRFSDGAGLEMTVWRGHVESSDGCARGHCASSKNNVLNWTIR
jgi:hypothetical protein